MGHVEGLLGGLAESQTVTRVAITRALIHCSKSLSRAFVLCRSVSEFLFLIKR